MSLFNLIFIRNILNRNLIIKSQSQLVNKITNTDFSKDKTNHSVLSKSNILSILLIANNDTHLNGQGNSLANKKLVSRNFIVQLLNKYWQETIFLSQPNLLSETYSSQLKSDGIAVYKSRYKKFLFDFSKALISGRIEATLQQQKDINTVSNNVTEIKYIWRKGLNFSLPKNIFNFLLYKRQLDFPNPTQLVLMKKLQQNKLPVFTIINNFNQIVVAEPSNELISKRGPINQIYQLYYDNFLWEKDHKPVYEGLFFVNPEDALEYQEYIKNKHINSSKYNNLNVFASGLDFYYKLVRISPPRVQFHLIPDLKELGKLIYKYQYYKNITFHNKQKHGRYFFQGQPIYLIQPILSKNKQTGKMNLVKYVYSLSRNETKQEYEAIFMNYQVALLAWQKFIEQNCNYNLPNKPNILIYNLEDFLKLYENNSDICNKNLLFVPIQESYEFVKANTSNKSQRNVSQILLKQFLRLQIITKRIVWSLTSRQPINW
uniref:hypothetical protein n=1 Tax=Anunuuluaehu liula TaxID=3049639 RepID=UPI003002AA9B